MKKGHDTLPPLPHSLFIPRQRADHLLVYKSSGTHSLAPSQQLGEDGQASCPGILLRGGQVEQHVRLDERSGIMVDRDELVVDVGGDVVQGDLGSATDWMAED